MWLVAGLGNPGDEYARTRHNVGFMALDALHGASGFSDFRAKFQGLMMQGTHAGHKAVFIKPQTYMNLSGQSVAAAARFFKIEPEKIIVFHDELDLQPGAVRVKKGGGNAGHNGLQSIQDHMGSADFWRVRIGIGRPVDKAMVADYVLHDFAKSDSEWRDTLMAACAKNLAVLLNDGPEAFGKTLTPPANPKP